MGMDSAPAQSAGNRIARNTTYLTGALIGQKVLSFLYVLILARLVGVSITGDYFSALSFMTLFMIFIDFGLTTAFIRQTARNRAEGQADFNYVITFKVITSILVVAALLGTVTLLEAMGRGHPDIAFVRWAAIVMVVDSFTQTLYGYFRGVQLLQYESIGTLLHRVMVMLVGITGLILGANPIITMIALLAGSFSNFLYAAFHLWRHGVHWTPSINWPILRRLLTIAIPFGIAGVFTSIYASSDNVLLSIFTDQRAVGLYALAAKIILAFQIIPQGLVAATFPAMSSAFVDNRDRLTKIFQYSMQYLMVFAIPLMVVLFLLADQIIILGWGQVWLDAVWPLRFLALGLPFLFLNFPVGHLLNASNQQTRNTINIAITVVVNIILNLVFIERYGYQSVTVVALISSALLFSLGLWYVRRVITIPTRILLVTLGKTLAAGVILALFGWWLIPQLNGRAGVVTAAVLMASLYVLLIFALRIIRQQDLHGLVRRLRRS